MNPGKFKRRIEIYDVTNEKDDYGTPDKKEKKLFSCWCQVKTRKQKESEEDIGEVLENAVTFITRYRLPKEIKNEMIIKYNSIKYEIKEIKPDEMFRRTLEIVTEKVS